MLNKLRGVPVALVTFLSFMVPRDPVLRDAALLLSPAAAVRSGLSLRLSPLLLYHRCLRFDFTLTYQLPVLILLLV